MTEILDQVKQALSLSTKAPWTHLEGIIYGSCSTAIEPMICELWRPNDKELITNAPVWLSSLLTTIESQKEEIEKWRIEAFANHPTQWAYDQACAALNKKTLEIEGYKAITELAVKALEPYAKKPNRDGGEKARLALAEIERLKNGTP